MFATVLYLALAAAAPIDYSPCAHTPEGERPAFDDAHRDETRALIREAVVELGGSETLARYLIAVAAHESSLQRGLIHRLPQDVRGAAAAYRNHRAQLRRLGHPLAGEPRAWLTYGLFGQTSGNFIAELEGADPRALCDAKTSVGVYVRKAQRVAVKLRRILGRTPTWGDLYRAIQRGKLRPDGRRDDWPKLARAHSFDPLRRLTRADLGR